MNAATQANTTPIAELVHVIVSAGVPYVTIVGVLKSEDKTVSRSIEGLGEEPLLCAKSTKLVPALVLH